jgi:chitodextrinase
VTCTAAISESRLWLPLGWGRLPNLSCCLSGEHWRRLLTLPVVLALAACSGGGTGSPAPQPTTPTGLTSSGVTPSSLTLSWTAATDGGGPGVGGYYVYRDGANIATVGATSFVDTGLSANTTYQYQVAAFDTSQPTPVASSLSAALGITTAALRPPPPPVAPAAPTGLASSGVAQRGSARLDAGKRLQRRDGLAVWLLHRRYR